MPTDENPGERFAHTFGAPDEGDQLARLYALSDVVTPFAVRVVATLRIPDLLDGGSAPADDLAARTGAEPDALRRVLRHLVTRGITAEPEPGVFAMTPLGKLLGTGHASRLRDWLDLRGGLGRSDQAFSGLLDSVLTGRPAFDGLFGRDFWQDLAAEPERGAAFAALMSTQLRVVADEVAKAYAWDGVTHVVDVGGGNGRQLATILQAHPKLRGTLLDLPATTAQAAPVLAEAGVTDRVGVHPGSFFDPLPCGADLYLLSRVLHDWNDEKAAEILQRCAQALGDTGKLLIVEPVLDDEEVAYPRTDVDLRMLVTLGGRERSLADFTALTAAAGLRAVTVGRTPSGRQLIECSPDLAATPAPAK
ncbi:methyltransferase [Streptomyces sp. NPDC023723]|uniref:methyltransferase n=1 Tax=Streptomyces sp. NPDC023723 TaxID=3154323 RepID=UPI0033C15EF0